jgi:hypothetical protein
MQTHTWHSENNINITCSTELNVGNREERPLLYYGLTVFNT